MSPNALFEYEILTGLIMLCCDMGKNHKKKALHLQDLKI